MAMTIPSVSIIFLPTYKSVLFLKNPQDKLLLPEEIKYSEKSIGDTLVGAGKEFLGLKINPLHFELFATQSQLKRKVRTKYLPDIIAGANPDIAEIQLSENQVYFNTSPLSRLSAKDLINLKPDRSKNFEIEEWQILNDSPPEESFLYPEDFMLIECLRQVIKSTAGIPFQL